MKFWRVLHCTLFMGGDLAIGERANRRAWGFRFSFWDWNLKSGSRDGRRYLYKNRIVECPSVWEVVTEGRRWYMYIDKGECVGGSGGRVYVSR